MNTHELEQLHEELSAATPGMALRLGIDGNTPDEVARRWERWNELADYEQRMQEEIGSGRKNRVFGLAAIGNAYGDLDRLESSGFLIMQMEEHLGLDRDEVSTEDLEKLVADAIDDAKNPERRTRVPARSEARQWWRTERDEYLASRKAGTGPLDLVEADEAVLLLRRRIVDALIHGQDLARNPRRRAEAERYVKREIAVADRQVQVAAKKYTTASKGFREMREREDIPEPVQELLKANERVAAERAAALVTFSIALDQATKRSTPFMAGVRRSLSERFPHQENEILASKAGRLAQLSSVEAALRLTPKDPRSWYPDEDGMTKKIDEYLKAAAERDRLDWDEMVDRRHLPRTPSLRGQGLAMACYDAMSKEQKDLSDRWRKLPSIQRSVIDDTHVNSEQGHEYSRMVGIPPMPALDMRDHPREPVADLNMQEEMIDRAADPMSMYAVTPPVVDVETSTTVEMGK